MRLLPGILHGLIETSEPVHETRTLGLPAREHPAVGQPADRINLHVPPG